MSQVRTACTPRQSNEQGRVVDGICLRVMLLICGLLLSVESLVLHCNALCPVMLLLLLLLPAGVQRVNGVPQRSRPTEDGRGAGGGTTGDWPGLPETETAAPPSLSAARMWQQQQHRRNSHLVC